MTRVGFVVVALAAVACGKGDKQGGATAKPADVAGVNALIPAALKDKFVFEETTLVEKRGSRKTLYKVVAPKGWKQEMESLVRLKPPTDMGFMTGFNVGTNCDGTCTPKDWAAVVDKQVKRFDKESKLLKDEKGPNNRTVIAEASSGTTLVLVASWKDGDREYLHCGGTLEKEVKEAAPAFVKACESLTVTEE
ncbi:MAG: hypothetical protein SFX73_21640 [Kofleriaceae bacterium]|nr:hypothetical protein [Kofleriaceae bacterium]